MRTINHFIVAAALLSIAACKKNDTPTLAPLASINVTNAVVGGNTLNVNTSQNTVPSNYFGQLTFVAGQSKVDLYDASVIPNVTYYDQTISTTGGSYFSLFLTGSSPSEVDNVLIKESYKNYADSVCGVRFINLSAGSNPISVDIAGTANGSETSSLAYKAYTSFKQYSANSNNLSYTFEFRDAATGTLLLSYTLTCPQFHNVTLALTGLPGSQSVLQDNDY